MTAEVDTPLLSRVRLLVQPIVADLGLEIYDLELAGGMLRLTLDTPAHAPSGLTLDVLSLASRLVSKELDAHDPIPSRYTLEVTSPGVERTLRTADHFRRAVGEQATIRLRDVSSDERRVRGVVVAADEETVTIDGEDGPRRVSIGQIDRARTVFEWAARPKPGGPRPRASKPAPVAGGVGGEADATVGLDGEQLDGDAPEASRTGKDTPS